MTDHGSDIAQNKKARFDYEILDTFEAGIVLLGSEVKSIREKKVSLQEAYGKIVDMQLYLVGMNIATYERANRFNHEPMRERKLLLHKQEIKRLNGKLQEKGLALIPLKMYFKNGRVKVLLGLGKGKTKYDKRHTIQKRDADRELQREFRYK